jgi:hypothetical protein
LVKKAIRAIHAVSVSCPKINHNHLDQTQGYKEIVRDEALTAVLLKIQDGWGTDRP